MPLDPSARMFLDAMAAFPQPYDVPLEVFRQAANVLMPKGEPLPLAVVEDRIIPGGDGQDMAIRIYDSGASGVRPIVVWAHGGSFVRGSLDLFDAARRAFAKASGAVIVAVDQRLSPEAQFPKPLHDVYAGLTWAAEHAAELGGDPSLLGIGGESSGGNLAAATALFARTRGTPKIALQILFSPLLDATCCCLSTEEFATGYLLTRTQLLWAYEQYAPGTARTDALLSPLFAPAVSHLPPAVIVSVEFDPVRDEAEAYARRLSAAGIPVRTKRIDGMVHHFPGFAATETLATLTGELLRELQRAE